MFPYLNGNPETRNARSILFLINGACHTAFPNVRVEFTELLQRLERAPVQVTVEAGTVNLTRDYFAATVEWLTRDSKRSTSLPFWIHEAYENKDWTVFAEAGVHGPGSEVMSYIIRCSEKWAAFTPDGIARQSPNSYLLAWSTSQARQIALVCKYAPRGETPEGLSTQPPSQKPVLLFNGEWDILDPPENVAGARELWPNSRSLTLPWQSHEISNTSVAMCMGNILSEFIDHGSTDGLDTACLQTLQPPVFRVK
jgi:hypothetical protein